MMQGPQANWLPDGRRLHLNHGPIDLIVEAWGNPRELRAAYTQAATRFETILCELVEELPELRRPPILGAPRIFTGSTAQRMERAVAPLARDFITPMAAVAGSVADEIVATLTAGRRLERAYVNNGGDIALHLAPGQALTLAIAGTGHGFGDRIVVHADSPVRGIATSGWRGRSFSLGIADAVTVLAKTAAQADAAVTVIANAVDLPDHPAIVRVPARDLAPDSDLGDRLVTQGVRTLFGAEIAAALDAGLVVANALRLAGLIEGAALFLNGESRVCGDISLPTASQHARSFAPPSVLPDISPSRGEISLSRTSPQLPFRQGFAMSNPLPISPHAGEMSGRTEGGNVERNARPYTSTHQSPSP